MFANHFISHKLSLLCISCTKMKRGFGFDKILVLSIVQAKENSRTFSRFNPPFRKVLVRRNLFFDHLNADCSPVDPCSVLLALLLDLLVTILMLPSVMWVKRLLSRVQSCLRNTETSTVTVKMNSSGR